MTELDNIRSEIDKIDDELKMLFVKRMELVLRVAEYKNKHGLPVRDSGREIKKLESLSQQPDYGFTDEITEFFKNIMAVSRNLQQKTIGE